MSLAVYQPRVPEHTVLWQCVQEHLPAFLAKARESERTLPTYVIKELEGFLRCGQLEQGFLRVACAGCGFVRLVPFSCKGRGVCPSCVSRRMSDTAAHLTDHVLPRVPVRQWVLSLPAPLRYLVAWDTALCAAVVAMFMRAVHKHLARVAKREGIVTRMSDATFGAVCMIQRWGGSANLNVHLHALVADGVFVEQPDATVSFRALPSPTQVEVAAVAWEVCERAVARLRSQGRWMDASPDDDAFAQREPLLAELYGASIAGTLVLGNQAGQRQVRLYGAAARAQDDESGKVRNAYGFDVHAAVRVSADDRAGLERLARYMTRPPLSKQRLERQADGRYRITLKRAWRDGTTHIILEGPELVGRLAALVPPPRFNLTRYFGVFAPRAKLRSQVVPERCAEALGCKAAATAESAPESVFVQRRRMQWAKLLARVFSVDVLVCPKCSSSMQQVEVCTTEPKIRAALQATTGPPPATDRAA